MRVQEFQLSQRLLQYNSTGQPLKKNCKHTALVEIDTKIPCSDGYGVLGIPEVRRNPENRVFASDISPLSMNPDLLIKPSFDPVTVPISPASAKYAWRN